MLTKKRLSVGLDIGGSYIKLVALHTDPRRHGHKLVKYAIRNIDRACAEAEKGQEEVLVDAIRHLYSELRLDEKRVRISLSGNSIVVRYLTLPAMSLEEVKQNIRYEGGQHIPFNIDEVEIDCDIIKNGSSQRTEVIMAAARNEACQRLLDIVGRAGLMPTLVDVDSVAIMNAFNHAEVTDVSDAVALLHIGAGKSEINILQEGVPVFSRILDIGGDELTLAISKGLGIDSSRAEELKVFGDIIVKPFAEEVLERMARQIRSSFDYYEGMSGVDVSQLFISGGGSLYEDFCDSLHNSLGIETSFWDPFENIDVSAFKTDEQLNTLTRTLVVAVGLAIRSLE